MKRVAGPPWVPVAGYAMQLDRSISGRLSSGDTDTKGYRSVRWWDDEIKEKIDLLGQTPPQRVAGKSRTITQRCLQRGQAQCSILTLKDGAHPRVHRPRAVPYQKRGCSERYPMQHGQQRLCQCVWYYQAVW